MQRFRNILVGVDLASGGTTAADLAPATRQAIDRALWLAAATKAEVTFFGALESPPALPDLLDRDIADRVAHSAEDSGRQVLDELLKEAAAQSVAARAKLVAGTPWLEIIRQVLREQHDLVIVGTRNLNAPQRMLFGSTGMKLLRNCPCPVWITKPGPVPEVANVLVASDLGDVSQDALNITVAAGQLRDIRVHLLHACQYSYEQSLLRTGLPPEEIEKYRARCRDDAEQALRRQLAGSDYRTLTYGVQLHVVDPPADVAIVAAIAEYQIDLLVMGTVGRSGIPGMLIGNTAERLLPEVSCSILAIKPAGFVTPVTL